MAQVVFLTSLFAGIACLVAAIAVARLRWRADVEPFGLHTGSVKVLAHPASYAAPSAVAAIRLLTVVGGVLLAAGVLSLLYQLLADVGRG